MSQLQCQFWATKKWYPRGKSLVKTIDFPGGVVCLRFAPVCSGLQEFGGDAAIRSDPTFTRTSPRLRSYAGKLPQMIIIIDTINALFKHTHCTPQTLRDWL